MKPILLIHGGAGSKKPTGKEAALRSASLSRILSRVYPKLKRGASALDAVTLAVELLENDPLYNAGYGSKIQRDGVIRMSASIMDGHNRRFAGCINVLRVKNPVHLARKLLREEDRVLEGRGAERYALSVQLPFASPYTPERLAAFKRQKRGKTGTVGAVAIDSKGRLAAATSTGGKGFEYPGRVSDSATVAANFANRACAVSVTGTGEEIMEFAVAARIATQVESGANLGTASKKLLHTAKRSKASFGWIALDRSGSVFAGTSTPHLIWALAEFSGITINP